MSFDITYISWGLSQNPKDGAHKYIWEIIKRISKEFNISVIHGYTNKPEIFDFKTFNFKLTGKREVDFLLHYLNTKKISKAIKTKLFHSNVMESYLPENSILTIYHVGHLIYKFVPSNKYILFLLRKFVEKNLEKAEKIITISRETKKDLIKFFGIERKKIEVIYYGIEIPKVNFDSKYLKKKYSIDQNKRVILTVSRIIKERGIHNVIEAIKLLPKDLQKNIHYIVVGNSYDKDYLTYLKNISKNISISFYVGVEDIKEFLYMSDIFVFPSLMKEGFGLAPLEAMSFKKPVILSNQKTFKEVYGNVPIYFRNVEELAKNIEILLTNDKEYEKRKHLSFKIAKKYNWKNAINRIKKIYNSLI
ncbi:MAG: glycosyltransferase family 4 protein [Candidatus Aenigmatarchaeota archaeon]